MRIPRIFVAAPLKAGAELALPPGAHQHVSQVLRLGQGAPLQLFNGDGQNYPATVTSSQRKTTWVQITGAEPGLPEPELPLTLAAALAKGDRMDLIFQKAVELGVHKIQPLLTDRSVPRPAGERLQRRMAHWLALIQAACEQCGRSLIPELAGPQSLATLLQEESPPRRIALDPKGDTTLAALTPPTDAVMLLIGPEGGWSPAESTAFAAQGITRLWLGPRVLRTETAAITAVGLVQAYWGDLGNG